DGDVLPLAAAASAEYGAARLDAIWSGPHDVGELGSQKSAALLYDARVDEVAGRCEGSKDDPALVMRQRVRAVREALDREVERRVVGGRHAAPLWTRGDAWGKCAASAEMCYRARAAWRRDGCWRAASGCDGVAATTSSDCAISSAAAAS